LSESEKGVCEKSIHPNKRKEKVGLPPGELDPIKGRGHLGYVQKQSDDTNACEMTAEKGK